MNPDSIRALGELADKLGTVGIFAGVIILLLVLTPAKLRGIAAVIQATLWGWAQKRKDATAAPDQRSRDAEN